MLAWVPAGAEIIYAGKRRARTRCRSRRSARPLVPHLNLAPNFGELDRPGDSLLNGEEAIFFLRSLGHHAVDLLGHHFDDFAVAGDDERQAEAAMLLDGIRHGFAEGAEAALGKCKISGFIHGLIFAAAQIFSNK